MDFDVKFDVVVAGGGVAGAAAAVAAARRGMKVVLIEKTAYWGGLATTGMVNHYLPLCDGNGTQVCFGLNEEFLNLSIKYGPGKVAEGWQTGKNLKINQRYQTKCSPASFIIGFDEILQEENVALWLDTVIIGIKAQEGRLKKLIVANKSGIGTISGKVFVDATGDSDVAYFCGENCHLGANAGTQWTVEYNSVDVDNRVLTPNVKIGITGAKSITVNDVPAGVDGKIVSNCIINLRNQYRKVLQDGYAAGTYDRFSRYPLFLPAMASLRHTRCIEGQFALLPGMDWQRFDDSIGIVGDWRKPGFVWEIPYRTLLPRAIKGLLAAGRCTAARDDAWEVTRVIPTAVATGEAAGVAAALAVKHRTTPDNLDYEELAAQLQKNKLVLHFADLGLSRPEVASKLDESNSEAAGKKQ